MGESETQSSSSKGDAMSKENDFDEATEAVTGDAMQSDGAGKVVAEE